MVIIFAFNTGKAVMEDATIEVAIDNLSDIGPKKAILLGKALIIDLSVMNDGGIRKEKNKHQIFQRRLLWPVTRLQPVVHL